jgi:hypothetical protein
LTPPTQLTSLMMVLGSLSWILLTGLSGADRDGRARQVADNGGK